MSKKALDALLRFAKPVTSIIPRSITTLFDRDREKFSEISLLPPATTIIVSSSMEPTEIRPTPVSYCVIVDINNGDQRFLHHFTGIGPDGEIRDANISVFEEDLLNFCLEYKDDSKDITLHRMSGWEDASSCHLSESPSNYHRRENLGLLKKSLEKVSERIGLDFKIKENILLGEFTFGKRLSFFHSSRSERS